MLSVCLFTAFRLFIVFWGMGIIFGLFMFVSGYVFNDKVQTEAESIAMVKKSVLWPFYIVSKLFQRK